ncbi:nuclear pore complex protein NUP62-like [Limulus polyphemus]|uniref:Nuclear pore complex protein NUP62-like n=1 Tax=Limulus polyphemus TaxID=6850 RepID=A0ABM1BXC5_LIMPO|nr:nuclear pore complex protein NUP62-like [Limulus polyphemus]
MSSVGGFQFGSSVPSSFTPVPTSSVGGFQFGSSVPSSFTPATVSSVGGFQFGSSAPPSFTPATTGSVGGFQFNFGSCSTAPSMQSSLEKNPPGGFKFSLGSSAASSSNKEKGFSFTFGSSSASGIGSSESGKPDTTTSQHVATGLNNPPSVFSPLITNSIENQKPSLFSSPQIFKESAGTPHSSTQQVKFGQNNQPPVQGIFSNLSTGGGFSAGQSTLFQNSSGVFGSGSSGQNTAFGGADQNQNSFGSSNNKLHANFDFAPSPNQSLSFGHSNLQQSTPGSFQFGTGSGNAFQSPGGFNFSSASQGANFNFSAKPNINFGGATPLSSFGNPAPSSRPGTPQGGTLFSVGANSKPERRTARRRPQRK